jgi:hypothetical protein
MQPSETREPGAALIAWLQEPPKTDAERAVRLDLRAYMTEATKLREAWKEVQQAIEDMGHKYRAQAESASGHSHDEPWLEGYRQGYQHAEKRQEYLMLLFVRMLVLIESAPIETAQEKAA